MDKPVRSDAQILKPVVSATGECPPLEALGPIAEGAESSEHVRACGHCQNELALLREFQSAAPRAGEAASLKWIESELRRRTAEIAQGAPTPNRPPRLWDLIASWLLPGPQWRTFSLAAASLVVVMIAGTYFRTPSELSRSTDTMVFRSQQFAAIAPVGDIASAPVELKWQPVPDASTYRIRLMEVDRTEIWSVESRGTAIAIPPELRRQMAPGRTFSWEVAAMNSAGEKVRQTGIQTFHISLSVGQSGDRK